MIPVSFKAAATLVTRSPSPALKANELRSRQLLEAYDSYASAELELEAAAAADFRAERSLLSFLYAFWMSIAAVRRRFSPDLHIKPWQRDWELTSVRVLEKWRPASLNVVSLVPSWQIAAATPLNM